MARQEEKKGGRKSTRRADWMQIVKTVSSAKVLGLNFSHSGKNLIFKFILSNFSGNDVERVFQMINLNLLWLLFI